MARNRKQEHKRDKQNKQDKQDSETSKTARQARQAGQERPDQNGNQKRNPHSPLLARNTPRDPLHPRCTTNKNGRPARDNYG